MNPILYGTVLKVGVGIAMAAIVFAMLHSLEKRIYQKGYDKATSEAKLREQQLNLDFLVLQKKRDDEVLKRDAELKASFEKLSNQRYKEGVDYAKALESVRRDAHDGNVRLSVDTIVDHGSDQGDKKESSRAASGSESGKNAELLPRVTDDILRIAGSHSKNVRDYNELLKYYHELELRCSD